MSDPISLSVNSPRIGDYTFEEFLDAVESFHGYPAPGVVIGGIMVSFAMQELPSAILFDAISETTYCLPDAIQLLTPCTTGNGWLRVFNLGRYAVSLYDKYQGQGVRVFVDSDKIRAFSEIHTWFFKLKPKKEQDSKLLMRQIREAGSTICRVEPVTIQQQFLHKRHKDRIVSCPLCGEAYPLDHGRICRACQGQTPYQAITDEKPLPTLHATAVEDSIGKTILHDLTEIVPGESKGPAFKKGQIINAGDLCRLHQMGKQHVYVDDGNGPGLGWIHENEAAVSFAAGMAGKGVCYSEPPREGKVNFMAEISGLLIVNDQLLEIFNRIPGVMCATRKSFSILREGQNFAGTRAIPLFLPKSDFEKAMQVLQDGPLFRILPLRKAKVGILVTGTEVFRGLVQDRFIPIIRAKTQKYGCSVVNSKIVPDEKEDIMDGVREILDAGADLLVTTAGLSVDPDDVTRQGLIAAGAEDMLYGAPILPGAMTLLARIGTVQVIGVPACALYFKTTSFDLLLPRLLAGIPITRSDLSRMGHGAFCLECKSCSYPKCPFGK
ncbi:MAG: FmdE family protein [Desulfatirhabdiaceae bacterium]